MFRQNKTEWQGGWGGIKAVSTSTEPAVITEARHTNRFFQIISKPCKQTTKRRKKKKEEDKNQQTKKPTGLSPSLLKNAKHTEYKTQNRWHP